MGLCSVVCVMMGLAMVQVSLAQDNQQEYLDPHNTARSQVGVGPVTWDTKLEGYARDYANQMAGTCNMVHSGGPYGENLAWGGADMSATFAVDMWVGEKADYDYHSNTCTPGQQCGHYTQVVWRDTVRIGCAKVRCSTGGTFIICSYDPPGNYVGQRPY